MFYIVTSVCILIGLAVGLWVTLKVDKTLDAE